MGAVLSKSGQVDRYFRQQIGSGTWSPGSQIPADAELCRILGVSAITIKNVMARLAAEGLIVRRQRLGSFVAEQLRPVNIALLVDAKLLACPVSRFYRSFFQAAHEAIERAGYRVILISEFGDSVETLKLLLKNTHGVLSLTGLERWGDFFRKEGIPTVEVLTGKERGPNTILLDYQAMCRMAQAELEARGLHDFAVASQSNPADAGAGPDEHGEMALEMVRHDSERLLQVPWSWDCRFAYAAFKKWWSGASRRSAVFFYDDGLCDVALRAMLELGVKVPEELQILTQSNTGNFFHFPVSLARIEFDPVEIAGAAWEMLTQRLRQPTVDFPCRNIPPRFVAGDSLTNAGAESLARIQAF